ncbi:MAG: D-alanyl-D-alanine carboxypeptidase family protein [Opitutaceae bacterium]
MIPPRFSFAAIFFFATASLFAAAPRAKPTSPGAGTFADGTYKGAIVTDAATGNIIYEDQADIISPPASMAKLMTFAVLHDKLASGAITLATPIRITVADGKIGGSQVYLDPRETFPVEELLYAMMIHSANDASHALARASAGSVATFVGLMNAKAAEIGMTNTTFRTPHGLPPSNRRPEEGDLTSPRDFALLARYLLRKTDVTKYTSVRSRRFGEGVRKSPMELFNRDALVGNVVGVDGLKTGFTNAAGSCLTATAQRDGRRVIVVVMGSPDAKKRNLKVIELLDRGFAALPPGVPTISTEDASPMTAAPLPPASGKKSGVTIEETPPSIRVVVPPRKK